MSEVSLPKLNLELRRDPFLDPDWREQLGMDLDSFSDVWIPLEVE